MTVRTVLELANWDGRLDQQRENSKWPRSLDSPNVARDSYPTPLSLVAPQPSAKISNQKRTESSLCPNPEVRSFFVSSSFLFAHFIEPRASTA